MGVAMINPTFGGGSVISASRSTPPTSGTTYVPDASGYLSSVDPRDVGLLLEAGFVFAGAAHRRVTIPAPVAAAAAVTVASTSLVAGASLSIAAQPDVPRQLQIVVNAGSLTLVAGCNLAMNYNANDGTTQTDNLSFGGLAAAGTQTLTTTKGVEHLISAVPTVLSAGAATNAGVQIGTNGTLALPVDTGFASTQFKVTKETKVTPTNGTLGLVVPADESIGTVTAAGALIAPTTAPDGTHDFCFDYSYAYPG